MQKWLGHTSEAANEPLEEGPFLLSACGTKKQMILLMASYSHRWKSSDSRGLTVDAGDGSQLCLQAKCLALHNGHARTPSMTYTACKGP